MTITWRSEVTAHDVATIRAMVTRAGIFSEEEVTVAEELAQDRFTRGTQSDYYFLLADVNGNLAGYTCYGRIPMTDARYDLYWIVVDTSAQRCGLATQLLERTEAATRAQGGKILYAETSSRDCYAPAIAFYDKHGFSELARIKDFYKEGDDKVMLGKTL